MKLKPIKFTYKESYLNDTLPMNKLQAGLIAEEVEEISPIFVKHNKEGNPEGVRYKQLPALLINAIQEQQAQIEELEARISVLEAQQ